jgi:uncharacterized protein (DUF433 family)
VVSVEEGLRHDAHPLIQFLGGPSGRRASLVGRGLDVWEVIAAIRDNHGSIREAAEYLEVPAGLVEAAVAYYEQLSAQIAVLLRRIGHDVEAVTERPDLVGRSDRIIFEVASGEGRGVITNNFKDFRPLAAEWLAQGRVHARLILLPAART